LYWDGSALCVGAAGSKTAHFDGDGLDLVTGDAYLINNTSVLNATTLGTGVVTTSVTTVGALVAGSISTGFGAIDNGTSNITTGGKLVVDVDGAAINGAGTLTLGAGNDASLYWDGTNLVLDTAAAAKVVVEVASTQTAEFDTDGLNLVTGDAYYINDTSVLAAATLGTGVLASSLTSLGTIADLIATKMDGVIGSDTARAGTFTTLDCTDGAFAVANLDIDGATDIGAALVDADLFIVDDGAGGTNRKSTLARLKTFIGAGNEAVTVHGVGVNQTLIGGMNVATGSFAADRTWTLPRLNTVSEGEIYRVKVTALAGNTLTLGVNANDSIDDLAVDVDLELNSDNGSISLMAVDVGAAGKWKIF